MRTCIWNLKTIYRPPRQTTESENKSYLQKLEEEMNDLCQWAYFQSHLLLFWAIWLWIDWKPTVVKEKWRDLEEFYNLHCMIIQRTNQNYCSLQVMITLECYSYEYSSFVQEMGDLRANNSWSSIIYGELMEKVQKNKTKTVIFQQTKDTDFEKLIQDPTGSKHLLWMTSL